MGPRSTARSICRQPGIWTTAMKDAPPIEAASIEATERQRRVWDKRAPSYDRGMRLMERLLLGDSRARVCSRAEGDVLEIAVGTGRNLTFYPEGIRLTGIELSPEMLAIARRRATRLGR